MRSPPRVERCLQLFHLQGRGNAEHAFVSVETTVRQEDVVVRIEFKEIAEGPHGGDSAEDGIILRDRLLEKDLLLSPWLPISKAAQFGGHFKKTLIASAALCLPLTVKK